MLLDRWDGGAAGGEAFTAVVDSQQDVTHDSIPGGEKLPLEEARRIPPVPRLPRRAADLELATNLKALRNKAIRHSETGRRSLRQICGPMRTSKTMRSGSTPGGGWRIDRRLPTVGRSARLPGLHLRFTRRVHRGARLQRAAAQRLVQRAQRLLSGGRPAGGDAGHRLLGTYCRPGEGLFAVDPSSRRSRPSGPSMPTIRVTASAAREIAQRLVPGRNRASKTARGALGDMNARSIVNADDFGLTPGINAGIVAGASSRASLPAPASWCGSRRPRRRRE